MNTYKRLKTNKVTETLIEEKEEKAIEDGMDSELTVNFVQNRDMML